MNGDEADDHEEGDEKLVREGQFGEAHGRYCAA